MRTTLESSATSTSVCAAVFVARRGAAAARSAAAVRPQASARRCSPDAGLGLRLRFVRGLLRHRRCASRSACSAAAVHVRPVAASRRRSAAMRSASARSPPGALLRHAFAWRCACVALCAPARRPDAVRRARRRDALAFACSRPRADVRQRCARPRRVRPPAALPRHAVRPGVAPRHAPRPRVRPLRRQALHARARLQARRRARVRLVRRPRVDVRPRCARPRHVRAARRALGLLFAWRCASRSRGTSRSASVRLVRCVALPCARPRRVASACRRFGGAAARQHHVAHRRGGEDPPADQQAQAGAEQQPKEVFAHEWNVRRKQCGEHRCDSAAAPRRHGDACAQIPRTRRLPCAGPHALRRCRDVHRLCCGMVRVSSRHHCCVGWPTDLNAMRIVDAQATRDALPFARLIAGAAPRLRRRLRGAAAPCAHVVGATDGSACTSLIMPAWRARRALRRQDRQHRARQCRARPARAARQLPAVRRAAPACRWPASTAACSPRAAPPRRRRWRRRTSRAATRGGCWWWAPARWPGCCPRPIARCGRSSR